MSTQTPELCLAAHRTAGTMFKAGGLTSFALSAGEGEPVVCLHGVPSSSYEYRKLVVELGGRGMRGIAFDLPGLGLADRPADFEYTFTGLGKWTVAAVDALALERFHLVVHDIGGPVGFEVVAAIPERIRSLTILNTILAGLGNFRKPWVMRPFEVPLVGEFYLRTMSRFLFSQLMRMLGVNDFSACPPAQAGVYVDLLKMTDGGRAFLKIMRCFEATPEKEALYTNAVRELAAPVQIIWGEDDSALSIEKYGIPAQRAAGVERFYRLPSKHFLMEDQAANIAEYVVELADAAGTDNDLPGTHRQPEPAKNPDEESL